MMKRKTPMEDCSDETKKTKTKMEEWSEMKMGERSAILFQEILIEILLRLPVKSLARFKCVSKSWFSLISNPSFARSHFDLALGPTHTILLSTDGCLEIASIDFNFPLLHDYTTTIHNPPFDDGRIIGSCRGFMLFDSHLGFRIWNPCTGVQTRIPILPSFDPQLVVFHGFGYDSSTDDYLITLGSYEGSESKKISVVIFSVRANTWKQFDGILPETLKSHSIDSYLGGSFFNGAIHWIASRHEVMVGYVHVIVAFDLNGRVFFEIALPNDFNVTYACELHVVIGGLLSVCPYICNDYDDKLLVMEEYNKEQPSWRCLRFSIFTDLGPYGLLPMNGLLPICLTIGGDIIGIDEGITELVKFNDKGEVLERRNYADYPDPNPGRRVVNMHTHTLLSLPCPAKDT